MHPGPAAYHKITQPPINEEQKIWSLMLPTTQFLTQAVLFDSNLLFRKTEKSHNLPQNVHSDDNFTLFCMLENN